MTQHIELEKVLRSVKVHELSIAQTIVDTAVEEAHKAKATRIVSITLSLGELTGIIEDQLQFCFPFVSKNTLAESARLRIKKMKGFGSCNNCQSRFFLSSLLTSCPDCGSLDKKILSGEELRIVSVEIDEKGI